MSIKQPDTGNSMNDYFSALAEFTSRSHHLVEAADEEEFTRWFNELVQIDRRAMLLFLRQHKDEIPAEHIAIAQLTYEQQI